MLDVDINASGIMNQFLFSGEFTIRNERPPTQLNLEKKTTAKHYRHGRRLRSYEYYRKTYMLLTIWLNTLPIAGPRTDKMTMITMATRTRINAYSTRPWPFLCNFLNMVFSSFPKGISDSFWEFNLDYIIPHDGRKGRKVGIKLRFRIIIFLKNRWILGRF